MAEIAIAESQNGQSFSAKSGDTLAITLPENPTTGYRWTVIQADSRLLKPASDDFSQGGGAVGGGGARTFRFTAAGTGEASLSFALARSWESGTPRQQFTIHVHVQ